MATASTSLYQQLLNDPRWQKKRLEIFNRDNWRCVRCGNGAVTLHVHHAYYKHGMNPWDYPEDSLSTLCANCHGAEHGKTPGGNALQRRPAFRPYLPTPEERNRDILNWLKNARFVWWLRQHPGQEHEYVHDDSPPTAEEYTKFDEVSRAYNETYSKGVR